VAPVALKRILVPMDFSPPSYRALAFAAQLAGQLGASLVLAHVVEPMMYPTDWVYPLPSELVPPQRKELKKRMEEILSKNGMRGDAILRDGRVWVEIVDLAKERKCDLIVIATHGYTGVKRALLGSVAGKVVEHAPCPVLTVREGRFAGRKPAMKKRVS
jgi:nucleotide-binding universal stress UspA family protein